MGTDGGGALLIKDGGLKRVDRGAVLPQYSTWQNQKGGQRRGAISGYKAGLLCRRCRPPMSKESQIRKL